MKYDIFISYVTDDTLRFTGILVKKLKETGINVFYDQDEMIIGDLIEEKINNAIKNSRYSIVVLSKHFFGKKWPEHELKNILIRQNNNSPYILPILYRIDKNQIIERYPFLETTHFMYAKAGYRRIINSIQKRLRS